MKHLIAWATVAAIALCSCAQAEQDAATATEVMPAPAPQAEVSTKRFAAESDEMTAAKAPSATPKSIPTERKIVRNGQMDIETTDIGATQKMVYNAVQNLGGYISADSREQQDARISQTFDIKVPFGRFDSLVMLMNKHAKYVDRLEVSSQDVTSEFIDTEARVRNAKALEVRYLQYLRESKNQKETLEVERELTNLRTEIESAEGRLRLLQNETSYSSLHLLVYQPKHSSQRFGGKFVDAVVGGWDFLMRLLLVIFSLWPLILLGSLGYLGFKRFRKK